MAIEFVSEWLKRRLSPEEREIIEILNASNTTSKKVVGRGTLTQDVDEARSAMVKDIFGVTVETEPH